MCGGGGGGQSRRARQSDMALHLLQANTNRLATLFTQGTAAWETRLFQSAEEHGRLNRVRRVYEFVGGQTPQLLASGRA